MSIDKLADAMEQFVNSEDWDEARRIVESNSELLSDQALQLLSENISDYRTTHRDDVAEYLEEHRALLERSRQVGVAKAFAEAEAHARETLEARRRQMDALRPAQPTPLQAAVWQLLDAESPEKVDQVLSQHLELTRDQSALEYLDSLIQQAQAAHADEAVRYLREYHELLRTFYELPPVMRALQEFMAVPTWTESARVLKNNPSLMSAEAISTLEDLVQEARHQNDEPTAHVLETYKRVLERSRQVGPDKAVEEIIETEEEPIVP